MILRRKTFVSIVSIWMFLFAFFFIGLAGRDQAFQSGLLARTATMHHRLARIFSLPVSRGARGTETRTLGREITSSLWGAALWAAAAVYLASLWRRAGMAEKPPAANQPSPNAGDSGTTINRRALLRGALAAIPALGGGFSLFTKRDLIEIQNRLQAETSCHPRRRRLLFFAHRDFKDRPAHRGRARGRFNFK